MRTLIHFPARDARMAATFDSPPAIPTTRGADFRVARSMPITRFINGDATNRPCLSMNWKQMSPTAPARRNWRRPKRCFHCLPEGMTAREIQFQRAPDRVWKRAWMLLPRLHPLPARPWLQGNRRHQGLAIARATRQSAKPAVAREASHDIGCWHCPLRVGVVLHQPRPFSSAGQRRQRKACCGTNQTGMGREAIANLRGPRTLPADGVGNRSACCCIPRRGGFALIGESYDGIPVLRCVESRLRGHAKHRIPDLFKILFNVAGAWLRRSGWVLRRGQSITQPGNRGLRQHALAREPTAAVPSPDAASLRGNYSARRALKGSTLAARAAGTALAMKTTAATPRIAAT